MGMLILLSVFACLVVSTCSVLYRFNSHLTKNESDCCNGTLGFATTMDQMPCSTMQCCDKTETVAVIPVNFALGYGFRCVKRRQLISRRCFRHNESVISTNDTAIKYEPRVCCDGHQFLVLVNKKQTALTIKCVTRRR